MIEFKIERFAKKETYTIGTLSYNIDNQGWVKLCNTLEDTVRPKGVKIAGQTAIPSGVYEFIMSYSPHFKRVLPLLLNVPNFTSIEIHNGTTDVDTRGCILVGVNNVTGKVTNSVSTLNILLTLLEKYKQEKYKITIG